MILDAYVNDRLSRLVGRGGGDLCKISACHCLDPAFYGREEVLRPAAACDVQVFAHAP